MKDINGKPTYVVLTVMILASFILAACGGNVNVTVKPDYQPQARADTPLASVPAKIKLLYFPDKRQQRTEAILIGRRQAAFGVPMGDVYSNRPISDVIRDSVKAELVGNGHSIVTDKEDFSMSGEIRAFWVGTEVTPIYWDVIGNVSVVIEVKRPTQSTPAVLGPYDGKNVERTYIYPSDEMITRVLTKCLEGAMSSMSSDPELARVFRTR